MPVLDVRKLTDRQITQLAGLFDKLENLSRRVGGVVEKESVDKIRPVIMEIDGFVGDLLGLSEDKIKYVQETVDELVKRRQAGTKKPKPETVKGREKMKKLKQSGGGKKTIKQPTTTLFEYMETDNSR